MAKAWIIERDHPALDRSGHGVNGYVLVYLNAVDHHFPSKGS
jgi:hypothetical protein